MRKKYSRYTKEQLEPLVKESKSYAEVIKKLGLRICGGNYVLLQRNIDKFQISCEHMLFQAANQGREFVKYEEISTHAAIKKRILRERGLVCEGCNLDTWLGKPITLEMDHIDGDNRNNTKTNIRILCPNCHSQTPTWKNNKK